MRLELETEKIHLIGIKNRQEDVKNVQSTSSCIKL